MDELVFREVTQEEITNFFLSDPSLTFIGLPDDTMTDLYYNKEYTMSPNARYAGAFLTSEPVDMLALLKYELFTTISVCCHFYLSTKLQGKGLVPSIKDSIIKYLKENTAAVKALSTIPSTCGHVIKTVERFGAKFEAKITGVCVWRQEEVDLLFYSLEIK